MMVSPCQRFFVSVGNKILFYAADTMQVIWKSGDCFGTCVNPEELQVTTDYAFVKLKLYGWCIFSLSEGQKTTTVHGKPLIWKDPGQFNVIIAE